VKPKFLSRQNNQQRHHHDSTRRAERPRNGALPRQLPYRKDAAAADFCYNPIWLSE
jgi:hypothetical protein